MSDVMQPLSDAQIETMTSKAVKRILHSEKAIAQSGMSHVRISLCTSQQNTSPKHFLRSLPVSIDENYYEVIQLYISTVIPRHYSVIKIAKQVIIS